VYIGFLGRDKKAYVEGPKAPQYLEEWAVYLLPSPREINRKAHAQDDPNNSGD
jgi:hypothetical protein